ncbi:hypothetical protein L1049_011992 [Liquidambar formosana]|uniref:Uncharacterized protein n=1 Tax=Liquidambar formosana TaxID=63359 RepID=A0AAP0RY86_LIQFO
MGAPGSFYGRLFPRNCLHLVHCSYSAHWLSQGLVDEEKLDSFNIPYYIPSQEEIQDIVEREGSFATEKMEMLELAVGAEEEKDMWARGEKIAKRIRSFTESIIAHQFGEEIMDKLYGELTRIVVDDLAKESRKGIAIVVVLRYMG